MRWLAETSTRLNSPALQWTGLGGVGAIGWVSLSHTSRFNALREQPSLLT